MKINDQIKNKKERNDYCYELTLQGLTMVTDPYSC